MEAQDLQAARVDLDKARGLAPRAGEVALMEARLKAREGNLRGAARLARRARMISPYLGEAWRAEAHWRQELGELGQARRIWQSVVDQTPQDIGAQLALGEVCAEEQRLGCAQQALGRVTALRPDVELGWLRLGSLLEESGKFSRAYENYAQCTQQVPVAAECWMHRVRMRERLSAVEASAEHHRRQRQLLMDEVAAMADAVAGVPGAAQDVARRLGSLEDPYLLEHFVGRCSWRREGLRELSFFVGNLHERQGRLDQAARAFTLVPRGCASSTWPWPSSPRCASSTCSSRRCSSAPASAGAPWRRWSAPCARCPRTPSCTTSSARWPRPRGGAAAPCARWSAPPSFAPTRPSTGRCSVT
jgi:tetratricopeptide (TPR) repeat protein